MGSKHPPNPPRPTYADILSSYLRYEEMSRRLATDFPKAAWDLVYASPNQQPQSWWHSEVGAMECTCRSSTGSTVYTPQSGTFLLPASLLTTPVSPPPQLLATMQPLDRVMYDFAGGDLDRELEVEINTDMGMVLRATPSSAAYPSADLTVAIETAPPTDNSSWDCTFATLPKSQSIHEHH